MRLSALLALLAIAAAAIAQEPTPADPEPLPAAEAPAAEAPATPVVETAPPVYAAPAVECCPIDVTAHRVKRSAKKLFDCQDVVPVTLCVENPADCCLYSVTLCVPCCCVDEARLCYADCGILGRGKVGYAWSCGLCVEIVFRARGDAVAVYTM